MVGVSKHDIFINFHKTPIFIANGDEDDDDGASGGGVVAVAAVVGGGNDENDDHDDGDTKAISLLPLQLE